MCTYKSYQIGSSWMELQVQRNSPPPPPPLCPLFPFPPHLPPLQCWVGLAVRLPLKRGRGKGVEREGRDCKRNELESLAVKFLEAWHYTHWLITMFTYHTSLSSLKLCAAYNTVPFLAISWGPGTRELIGMMCWVILPDGKETLYHLHPEFQTWQATVCRDGIVEYTNV